MKYIINVSKHGAHFFATGPNSAICEETARKLVNVFREKFPESEGFEVTCNKWVSAGTPQNF